MAKDQLASIVMGTDRLEWSVLARGRSGFRGMTAGAHELPDSDPANADPSEVASREAALVGALSRALVGHHGEVVLGVPTDRVLLKIVTLPALDRQEIAGMVELQVDKFAPFPVETLVVSHEILATQGQASTVLIVAVQTSVVDAAGARLRQAGVKATHVDVAGLGWWRLLADAGSIRASGLHACVLLAGTRPELLVFRDGVPAVLRALPALGGASPEAVVREVIMTLMTLELQHGTPASTSFGIWGDGVAAVEVQRALVAATGGAVALASLKDLGTAAEGLGRRWSVVGRVDLTPPSWRALDAQRQFRRKMILGSGGAIAIWALLLCAMLAFFYYQERKTARLEARAQTLQGPAKEVRELRRRVSMVRSYVQRSDSALEALREIASLQPAGIDLSAFDYNKGDRLKLSGEASEVGLVYKFKDNLDASPAFMNVALGGVRGSRTGHLFDIELQVRGGAQ